MSISSHTNANKTADNRIGAMAEIRVKGAREERFVYNCPHFNQGRCEKMGKRCTHTSPLYVDCPILIGNTKLKAFLE